MVDDYQPEALIRPDKKALHWIYRKRLVDLCINPSYADNILQKYVQPERYALYLIAQCIASELLDPRQYFQNRTLIKSSLRRPLCGSIQNGIPKLNEQLIAELEQMLN